VQRALGPGLSVALIAHNGTGAARIAVPAGNLGDLPLVEAGTAAVVLASFAYLACVGWAAASRLARAPTRRVKVE
jgi:hypothetical protein